MVEKKDLIAKMKQLLVEHEHPNAKCEMTKKCFFPRLLTAKDWSKDVVDTTLLKMREMRGSAKY